MSKKHSIAGRNRWKDIPKDIKKEKMSALARIRWDTKHTSMTYRKKWGKMLAVSRKKPLVV